MKASDIVKPSYRYLPDPRELNARLWTDPDFHTRLWTDPVTRNAFARTIDKALIDAISGKKPMEKVADSLSDIVMTQVEGELLLLGLRDHFAECVKPIKHIVLGLILAKMAEMKRRMETVDDTADPL